MSAENNANAKLYSVHYHNEDTSSAGNDADCYVIVSIMWHICSKHELWTQRNGHC
jgi:hypothetical protein